MVHVNSHRNGCQLRQTFRKFVSCAGSPVYVRVNRICSGRFAETEREARERLAEFYRKAGYGHSFVTPDEADIG